MLRFLENKLNFFTMKTIFVIQDTEKQAIGATFEESEAVRICKENTALTYRSIPFFASKGSEVTIKAGPIGKEYLPKNSNK
jgi:hypothetical protein